MADFSYIGKGPIYLAPYGGSGAVVAVGNCSQLNLAVAEDKKEQKDFTRAGGGAMNTVVQITGVTAALTIHDLSPANLALALRGQTALTGAGTVTAEEQVAYRGGLVPLKFLLNADETVTVTNADSTVTYTADTDYQLTRAGLVIPADSTITDGTTIKITYTRHGLTAVEALTASALEYRLIFDGLNEAQSGKAVVAIAHRVKFSPTSGLALLGDDFANLPLTADLLADPAITAPGLSRFIKIMMAD